MNRLKDELFRLTGTEQRLTSLYHPQSTGLTERFNQTVQASLLKVVNASQNDWDEHLPSLCLLHQFAEEYIQI